MFVAREGQLTFCHFELVAQALAKLARAHAQDLEDIDALLERELVDPAAALEYFERIEPELYRFLPSIHGRSGDASSKRSVRLTRPLRTQ